MPNVTWMVSSGRMMRRLPPSFQHTKHKGETRENPVAQSYIHLLPT